jgi:hypothetical protein
VKETDLVTSIRGAASVCGVSPFIVRGWMNRRHSHATAHVECEEQDHKSKNDDHHSDELTEMHRRP